MATDRIGERYAAALFEVIGSAQEAQSLSAELDALVSLFDEPALRHALANPRVTEDEKRRVLHVLSTHTASDLLRRFIDVVVNKGRVLALPEIAVEFRRRVDALVGEVEATVTSGMPLSEVQRQSVREALSTMTGRRVRLRTDVDPGLLAGIRARVGDSVLDVSVSGRLSRMKHHLLSKQTSEVEDSA